MPKINVLPKEVAQLIAAGEVVERPMSVVKELTENAIDAGATQITVEIKNGGVRYIRVTDNGCGIDREDIGAAFISHATSKISSAEDLDSIFTLGFRGEALPSIAAVSRMQVLTRTPESEVGTAFSVEGGVSAPAEDAGCPIGTTVIVRDLFYNTPARMKFLKKDVTEGNYITDTVTRAALSHPEIRFTLVRDGKQTLSTPGGDLYAAIRAVFGRETADALIECRYEHNDIKTEGYISRPLNNRPNRNMQYFFVNGRPVRIPAAAPALDNAYKNSIMVGKFLMCFLCLTVDPNKTDVNVHPTKTEIRFSDESKIYEAVFYAARAALSLGDTRRPAVHVTAGYPPAPPKGEQLRLGGDGKITDEKGLSGSPAAAGGQAEGAGKAADSETQRPAAPSVSADQRSDDGPKGIGVVREAPAVSAKPRPVAPRGIDVAFDDFPSVSNSQVTFCSPEASAAPEKKDAAPAPDTDAPQQAPVPVPEAQQQAPVPVPEAQQQASATVADAPQTEPGHAIEKHTVKTDYAGAFRDPPEKAGRPDVRVVGEIYKTYILAELEDRLLIIDKHAAHERMIYNALVANKGAGASQFLLSGVRVTLSGAEHAAVTENLSVFTDAGYEIEDFGGTDVIVRACPAQLTQADVGALVQEMAGELTRGNRAPVPEKLDWLYHSTACRAAVKAGDGMSLTEMQHFVEKLLADDGVRYCPHGRPVCFELKKSELERRFGRLG